VLLVADALALAVFAGLELRLLAGADVAVGRGIGLVARLAFLAGFQVRGFPVGQLARMDAIGDA
jgi:hypothetical protein